MPRRRKSFPMKATVIPPKGLYTLAARHGVSRADAARYWKEAGQSCFSRYESERAGRALGPHRIRSRGDYFQCVMGVTKKILGHKAAKMRGTRRVAAMRPRRKASNPIYTALTPTGKKIGYVKGTLKQAAMKLSRAAWLIENDYADHGWRVWASGVVGPYVKLPQMDDLGKLEGRDSFLTRNPLTKSEFRKVFRQVERDSKAAYAMFDAGQKDQGMYALGRAAGAQSVSSRFGPKELDVLRRLRGISNPLTSKESREIMGMSREHKRSARGSGKRRGWHLGQAHAYWDVAEEYGPMKNPAASKSEALSLFAAAMRGGPDEAERAEQEIASRLSEFRPWLKLLERHGDDSDRAFARLFLSKRNPGAVTWTKRNTEIETWFERDRDMKNPAPKSPVQRHKFVPSEVAGAFSSACAKCGYGIENHEEWRSYWFDPNRGWRKNPVSPSNRKKAEAAYRRLYKEIERVFSGGMLYGVDWPTLRAVRPDLAEKLMAAASAMKNPLTATETRALYKSAREAHEEAGPVGQTGPGAKFRRGYYLGIGHGLASAADEYGDPETVMGRNPLDREESLTLMRAGRAYERIGRGAKRQGFAKQAARRFGMAEAKYGTVAAMGPDFRTKRQASKATARAKKKGMMANPLLLSVNPPRNKTVRVSSLPAAQQAQLRKSPAWKSYRDQHGMDPDKITLYDMGGSKETRVLAGMGEKLEEQYSTTGAFAGSKKSKISKHWVHEYEGKKKPIVAYDPQTKTFHTFPRSGRTMVKRDGYIHG